MAKVAQIVRKIDLQSQGVIFSSPSATEMLLTDKKILNEQLHELYMSDYKFQGI